jgi:hypothetical protein
VGIPLSAWLIVRAFSLHFDPSGLRPLAIGGLGYIAVFVGVRFGLQNVHRPKHWARRVAVGENGVRYGRPWILPWTPTVPWTDIVGVTLDRPSRFRPAEPGATVWQLREGLHVRVGLHGSRRPPEELIFAARSYMAGTKQSV